CRPPRRRRPACRAAAHRRGGRTGRAPPRGGPPARRGAAEHPGAPQPPTARSRPGRARRARAERPAAARPAPGRWRADVRRRRGSVAARAGVPRETALTLYQIRRATAADAGVLARHRAEMFRDMRELPDDLYDKLGFTPTNEMRYDGRL